MHTHPLRTQVAGGAMFGNAGVTVTMIRVQIIGCSASSGTSGGMVQGGALYAYYDVALTMTEVQILGCNASTSHTSQVSVAPTPAKPLASYRQYMRPLPRPSRALLGRQSDFLSATALPMIWSLHDAGRVRALSACRRSAAPCTHAPV
jgi:hypothetical protein